MLRNTCISHDQPFKTLLITPITDTTAMALPRGYHMRKVVTLGMDLVSFSQALPSEKLLKSILRVTILLLIVMPWWILCLP